MGRVVLMLIAAGLISGCYVYRPLPGTDPRPGQAVRLVLSSEGTDQVTRTLGPRIVELEGKVAVVRADSLRFLVQTARTPEQIESYFEHDTVSLARTAISSIMERKLSAGPTLALGGVFVAGAVGAAAAVAGESTSNKTPPPSGPVNPD